MLVKVFNTNCNGKIEFTKSELEKLLTEVYEEGKKESEVNWSQTWHPNSPYILNRDLGDLGDKTITVSTTIFPKTEEGTCENGEASKCSCDCDGSCKHETGHENDYEKVECDNTIHGKFYPISARTFSEKEKREIDSAIRGFLENSGLIFKKDDPFSTLAKELNF